MSPHPLEVGLTMSVAEQVAGSHVNREHTVDNDAPGHPDDIYLCPAGERLATCAIVSH